MDNLKKSWSLELEMHSGLGAQTLRGLAPGISANQSLASDKQHIQAQGFATHLTNHRISSVKGAAPAKCGSSKLNLHSFMEFDKEPI